MSDKKRIWLILGGMSCVALGMFGIPELAAQRFDDQRPAAESLPIQELERAPLHAALNLAPTHALAATALHRSSERAAKAVVCQMALSTLPLAQEATVAGDRVRAAAMLRALIVHGDECLAKERDDEEGAEQDARAQSKEDAARLELIDRARLQLGHLLLQDEEYAEAAQTLAAISANTPVGDYVLWYRAQAHEGAGEHALAAQLYASVYALKTSPLHWRARVRQGHALARAEQWAEARPVLAQVIELFPDYPRRHVALYQHGQALEHLDNRAGAARSYQQAFFEFPFRAEGQLARKALARLAEHGVVPTPISRDRLLERYRRLRIDKHWPLAHELMVELREAHATESGTSAFENQVLLQIGLNAYHGHDFEGAVTYLSQLRDIYDAGHRDGVDRRTMYNFLSRALTRFDRHEEAIAALELMNQGSSLNDRLSSVATYYEENGQYKRALEIYDRTYSASRKRGWHYSYLLYKSGQFDRAYENLLGLAERSRSQRRAKYLYWAGRSLERAGDNRQALSVFSEVQRAYTTSYYGMQAANRILDIGQRQSLRTDLVQASHVLKASDLALDALDEAAEALAGAGGYAAADPRMMPLHAGLTPGSSVEDYPNFHLARVPAHQCQDGTPINPAFCKLHDQVGGTQHARALKWATTPNLAAALLSGAPTGMPNQGEVMLDDDDRDDISELDRSNPDEARIPEARPFFKPLNVDRVRYHTQSRIYWNGRHGSDLAFVRYQQGQMLGPIPDRINAYDDDSFIGGLDRAVAKAGALFPELKRAQWLWMAGIHGEARHAIRDVALEFRTLNQQARPTKTPHELPQLRWAYFIDNRRSKSGLWGLQSEELRYPVPTRASEAAALLTRQQTIIDQRRDLEPILLDAFKEAGDYHLVRRHALSRGGWFHRDPSGDARQFWTMAYPRAFPEQVIPLSKHYNVNPYLIWALMLVESSFNPDSLSRADAMGLLQVIPRTGLKIAEMFGDEDFGPFDLLEESNSIHQGIFYFSRLVQKFHGQELLAFAGYNGGPHRIAAWLDKRGHDIPLDEFIEEIPFAESRGYAKKVLRFLGIYLRIYEGVDTLYVGQNLRLDYKEMPNF